jgi:lipopolysaccharide biosynthesis regulator YciM
VAEQLEGSGEVSFSVRKAHYLCEQARELNAKGDSAGASQLLLNAIEEAPEAPRPRLLLGQLQLNMNQASLACDTLSQLFESSSVAAPLAAPSLVMAAQTSQRVPQTLTLLKSHYAQSPCIDVMDAIVSLEKTSAGSEANTRQRYIEHLQKQPSLLAASRWLAGADLGGDETRGPVQKALEQASRPLSRYRCAACGFEAKEHFWHCPGCQAWDSYPPRRVEEL